MNQETSAAAEPPERPAAETPGSSPEPAPSNIPSSTPVTQPEIVATPAASTEPRPVTSTLEPVPSDAGPPPPVASTKSSQGLPPWLPMFLLAVVPAIVVGAIVFALAGGGDSGSKSVGGVLDFFFRQGSSPENVQSFQGEAPPTFPTDFPVYDGASIYAGFQIIPEQGNGVSYYVIGSTPDDIDKVYNWYINAFNGDTWAVEIARSSDDFTGVRFTRPDDPDVSGDVTLHQSELDERTTIFVTYQDLTPAQGVGPADTKFVLKASRPLPANFPSSDIPIYDSKNGESVVTDTYIEKAPGGTSYIVSFLTKDSQDDVIEFYRDAFEAKGWTVEDAENDAATSFQVGIAFTDGPKQEVQGTILTDAFEDDTSYTKVDILVQVAAGRSRGN